MVPVAHGAPDTGPDACTQNPRPSPALGTQDLLDPSSYSSYNALQVGLTHRASANLVYQFSYTWSHCIDSAYSYGGLGFNNVTSSITNPYDWNADKGNCSFDIRHNISANAGLHAPLQRQPIEGRLAGERDYVMAHRRSVLDW